MEKDRADRGAHQTIVPVPRLEDYFTQQDSSSARLTARSGRNQPEALRPRVASFQPPLSPHSPLRTPQTPLGRSFSPGLQTPGPQGIRIEDDSFVFEFSSRYLRAGLCGESRPRCQLSFGPENQGRAGDCRRWLSSKAKYATKKNRNIDTWDSDHVLWRMDVRDLDLGLVAYKMERALRTAITEHLLIMDDHSKKRKFVLAIPPTMSHPVLSVLLTSLFNVFPSPPSVVLLSSPVLCTIGAGLRSALVVDIGWAGTLVSAVYEYREVKYKTSCRSMKLVSWEVRNTLNAELEKTVQDGKSFEPTSFEEAEEVLNRMVWCAKRTPTEASDTPATKDSVIKLPLSTRDPPQTLSIPFAHFNRPVETALFATGEPPALQDDDELPLPILIYSTLLSLSVDVRQACLSRITITGGGSNIPGLKARLIDELSQLIAQRGWDPVHNYGTAEKKSTRRTTLRPHGAVPVNEPPAGEDTTGEHANKDIDPSSTAPAHLQPPLPDPVMATIRSRATSSKSAGKSLKSIIIRPGAPGYDETIPIHGEITQKLGTVETLGTWESASLVAGLRLNGLVEVDSDKFAQHGLSSGIRMADAKRQSVQQNQVPRQSLVGLPGASGLGKGGERDSGTWTLGAWA